MKKGLVFGLLLAVALPAGAASVDGDATAAAARQAHPASKTPPISDRQLKIFAAARADLNRIRMEYRAKLKAAETTAERQRIVREGSAAVRKALKKHGMTPEQFREMAFTIRDNPELREKLEAMEPDNL
ncbi:MAG TPA: DUF4168 domain-containing protein [Gammaproteobacteria bacterium]|nr:DUF4168 domain-containing protein [Gammaproteobacteria bacterium]